MQTNVFTNSGLLLVKTDQVTSLKQHLLGSQSRFLCMLTVHYIACFPSLGCSIIWAWTRKAVVASLCQIGLLSTYIACIFSADILFQKGAKKRPKPIWRNKHQNGKLELCLHKIGGSHWYRESWLACCFYTAANNKLAIHSGLHVMWPLWWSASSSTGNACCRPCHSVH